MMSIKNKLSDRTHCPICGNKLICSAGIKKECPTLENVGLKNIEGKVIAPTHYKIVLDDWYIERVIIYPFLVDSSDDASDIYHYDERGSHFVVETDYLDLPWHDKEKVIQKLRLFTAIS